MGAPSGTHLDRIERMSRYMMESGKLDGYGLREVSSAIGQISQDNLASLAKELGNPRTASATFNRILSYLVQKLPTLGTIETPYAANVATTAPTKVSVQDRTIDSTSKIKRGAVYSDGSSKVVVLWDGCMKQGTSLVKTQEGSLRLIKLKGVDDWKDTGEVVKFGMKSK